jgi:uracil-DNA glycosylase
MNERELRHFAELRSRISTRLEEIQAPHREEQIEKYPWLCGALGAVPSDVMFICENPSLAGVRQGHVQTPDGGPPDFEAQWWGGARNPAAKRFRRVLCELGLKEGRPSAKGGWRCYITNAIKEANVAGDQATTSSARRIAQARAWADILRWEVDVVGPVHVFAVGQRAEEVVLGLQSEGLLPQFGVHRVCHYSDRGRGRTDAAVVADIMAGIRRVLRR